MRILPIWIAETGPIEMPVRSRNFSLSVSNRTLHAIRKAPLEPIEQSWRLSEVRVETFARTVQSCRQLGSSKRRDRSCRLRREMFKAIPLNIGICIKKKRIEKVSSITKTNIGNIEWLSEIRLSIVYSMRTQSSRRIRKSTLV